MRVTQHRDTRHANRPTGHGVVRLVLAPVAEHEAPPDVEVAVEDEVLVQGAAGRVVGPAEGHGIALDRVHVDHARRGVAEPPEIVGHDAERPGDRDCRIL